jgi:hypothetical protein
VLAPVGIIVKACPAQMVPLFTANVGDMFTVKELIAVFVDTQPCALKPTTE